MVLLFVYCPTESNKTKDAANRHQDKKQWNSEGEKFLMNTNLKESKNKSEECH